MDAKKEEKKNMKLAKTFILTLILISILMGIWIMYNLIGTNNVSLKDITEDEKNQIIQILNLEIESDNIEFEKISVPKTYKDIYYTIYFYTSNDENIDNTKQNSNLDKDFEKIGNNKYNCTISNMGKSIEVLEQIRSKYKK